MDNNNNYDVQIFKHLIENNVNQCADPWHFGVDADPDPAIFVINLQDANKSCLKKVFLLFTFWRYIYIIFKRWKVKKKSQKVRIKVFLLLLGNTVEGSGSATLLSTK
jgi:hypothetical protein